MFDAIDFESPHAKKSLAVESNWVPVTSGTSDAVGSTNSENGLYDDLGPCDGILDFWPVFGHVGVFA